jgi:hypothetical protein
VLANRRDRDAVDGRIAGVELRVAVVAEDLTLDPRGARRPRHDEDQPEGEARQQRLP